MKRVKKPAVPVNTRPSRTDIDGRHAAKLLAAQSILDQVKVRNVGLSGIATSITRRAIRPETVNALAQSMKEIGLINPITIRPADGGLGFYLIAGRHRLEAAEELGWKDIPTIILEGLSADEAELREIDENLIRADLTDAERAAHHARRQELHQQKHPETKHGGDRKGKKSSGQNGHSNERYTKETATQTGESERTVRRHVARGKKIPNVADVVGTSLAPAFALSISSDCCAGDSLASASSFGALVEEVSAKVAPTPEQSAAERKAHNAAHEGVMVPADRSPPTAPAPTVPAEPVMPPADGADQIEELTSEQQDQILHLMLVLLASVDHKHRKRFHKHLIRNSRHGVYLSPRGRRRWMDGGYAVDASLLNWVLRGLDKQACSLGTYDEQQVAQAEIESPKPPKRKRRTKGQIAADKATQREAMQDLADGMAGDACVVAVIHREIAEAIAADPSALDEQLAKRFEVAPRTVAFVRENGAPTTCSTAAADPYADLPPVVLPEPGDKEEAEPNLVVEPAIGISAAQTT
jgi:hypothetical protein